MNTTTNADLILAFLPCICFCACVCRECNESYLFTSPSPCVPLPSLIGGFVVTRQRLSGGGAMPFTQVEQGSGVISAGFSS